MNGYLVKHAVFGVGKIVDWSGTIRQPFKVRFYSKGFANNEMSFDKSSLSRQVNRTVLPPGSRCCSDRGGCVVVEISKFAAKDEPAEYRVEFEKDGGLRATVSEADLEPSAIAETRDPGLLLGGLQAGGYSQFRARERLTEVVHRMFREGNGLHALLSSRVDLRPHQAYVAGVVLLDRRRRYLLADEVGLGKTIEAGIIMSDLLCQHPDSSVLILTPGTLTQQWLCELYCKFGQHTFVMSDLHEGHSGTLNTNRLIVSLTSAGELIPLVMHRQWDMVIYTRCNRKSGAQSDS
jgi:ATP-dependent helicase HepA